MSHNDGKPIYLSPQELKNYLSNPENQINEIIGAAEEFLLTAKVGLNYLDSENDVDLMIGLRIVIIFCRHFTNIIQRLRKRDDKFDEWYEPWKEEMKNDPFLKFVYALRNDLLKEGQRPFTYMVGLCDADYDHPNVKKLDKNELISISRLRGRIEKKMTTSHPLYYYIDIEVQNCPNKMLNQEIKIKTPKNICELYILYMNNILDSCKKYYSKQS